MNYTFEAGWNTFGLAYEAQEALTATAADAPPAQVLARWTAQGWELAMPGIAASTDFPLTLGSGYFLYFDQRTPWTLDAVSGGGPVFPPLRQGWNLIGIASENSWSTTGDLIAAYQQRQPGMTIFFLATYGGGNWQLTLPGYPRTSQALMDGEAVFVYAVP